jgi:hypothetical protein
MAMQDPASLFFKEEKCPNIPIRCLDVMDIGVDVVTDEM